MCSASAIGKVISLRLFLVTQPSLLLSLVLLAQLARAQETPDPLQRHFEAAQTYQLTGNLKRAETEYRKVLGGALRRLGNLRASEDNYADAIELLTAAVETQPDGTDARVDLAIAHLKQGNVAEAATQAGDVLAQDPRNPRATHLLGKIHFLQGNYEAAAEKLEATLALQSDFEVAYTLALAYLKLKKLPETMLLFDEMLNSMSATPELHILLGRAYRETGYYDQAVNEFAKAIAKNSHVARAHYYLGLTHLLQGGTQRFPQAREQFEAELALNPDHYFSNFYLGVIYLNERDFPSAEPLFEKAARIQPENPDPYFYLGRVYSSMGRLELAVDVLRKSIDLTQDFHHNNFQVARAHYLLGQTLNKLGQEEDGKSALLRSQMLRAKALRVARQDHEDSVAIGVAPSRGLPSVEEKREAVLIDEPPLTHEQQEEAGKYHAVLAAMLGSSYHNLGVIYARRQEFTRASEFLEKAARWKPDIDGLDRQRGLASFRAKRFAEAIAPLERHLARQADDVRVRQLLGLSYFMEDNFNKTAQVLRPLLTDPPDDPGLLYAWAVALVRTGEAETGGKIFSLLLEKNSTMPEVRLILGQAYAQQGESTKALEEFARALELDPSMQQANYYAGLLLLRQGRFEEARAHFEAELELNSSDNAAKYHLAFVLLLQQKTEKGVALLREIVSDAPDYADAHYQLGKVLLSLGQVKAAIERLETAVRLDPEKDYGYYQLSLAYRRDGRLDDAARALRSYQELKESGRSKKRQ